MTQQRLENIVLKSNGPENRFWDPRLLLKFSIQPMKFKRLIEKSFDKIAKLK